MISQREARRRLDNMIEAARSDEDGKFTKKLGGRPVTILIHPDEPEPAFLWGEGDVLMPKHIAIRCVEMYGC